MSQRIPLIPRRLNLPTLLPTDDPKVLYEYIKTLKKALNDQNDYIAAVMTRMQGADVLANRPSPGQQGATYFATDNGHFYVDDGTAWNTLV